MAAYLGEDREAWAQWDAVALIRAASPSEHLPMLVDQGLDDEFLDGQLRPELLEEACLETGYLSTVRRHAGYDHSYYFIASFIGEHIAFHAGALRG